MEVSNKSSKSLVLFVSLQKSQKLESEITSRGKYAQVTRIGKKQGDVLSFTLHSEVVHSELLSLVLPSQ